MKPFNVTYFTVAKNPIFIIDWIQLSDMEMKALLSEKSLFRSLLSMEVIFRALQT